MKKCISKALICSMALCTALSLYGCGKNKSDSSDTAAATSLIDVSSPVKSSKPDNKEPEYTLGTIVASGDCGYNTKYQLDENGLLVISGKGSVEGNNIISPWDRNSELIKTVIVKKGITNIGKFIFSGCRNLTSITIPDSVRTIETFAFENCSGLTGITIPESIKTIGSGAFSGWKSHQTIYIEGRSFPLSEWHSNWNANCEANIVWNA